MLATGRYVELTNPVILVILGVCVLAMLIIAWHEYGVPRLNAWRRYKRDPLEQLGRQYERSDDRAYDLARTADRLAHDDRQRIRQRQQRRQHLRR